MKSKITVITCSHPDWKKEKKISRNSPNRSTLKKELKLKKNRKTLKKMWGDLGGEVCSGPAILG